MSGGAVDDLLAAVAFGTPLRRAVEELRRRRRGGMFVLGTRDLDPIVTSGDRLDLPADADELVRRAEEDGAVVLSDDLARVVRARAMLRPPVTVRADRRGARHQTAERVAIDPGLPVVVVSEQHQDAHLYSGTAAHLLRPVADLRADVRDGLAALEDIRRAGDERGDAVDVVGRLDRLLVELGSDGQDARVRLAVLCREIGVEWTPGSPVGRAEHARALGRIAASEFALPTAVARDNDLRTGASARQSASMTWYADRVHSLVALAAHALRAGEHRLAVRLTVTLLEYFYRGKPWRDWIGTLDQVRHVADDDPAAHAAILSSLGVARRETGGDPLDELTTALAEFRATGDAHGETLVLVRLAQTYREHDDLPRAVRHATDALTAAARERDRGIALNCLSCLTLDLGNPSDALDLADRSAAEFRAAADPHGEAWAQTSRANALRDLGKLPEALADYERALDLRRAIGDRYGVAVTLHNLARATLLAGADPAPALGEALTIFATLGDRKANAVRGLLDTLTRTAD